MKLIWFCRTASVLGVILSLQYQPKAGGRISHVSPGELELELAIETREGYSYQIQESPTAKSRFWADVIPSFPACEELTSVRVPAEKPIGFFRVLEWSQPTFWYDWNYLDQALLMKWGFSGAEETYIQVDRPYDWYIDQADTGADSQNNCGPASVVMAARWRDQTFSQTAADARKMYPAAGGWWYTGNIVNYLMANGVPNTTTDFTGTPQLMQALAEGNLAILCINTVFLALDANSDHRVGRFYGYSSGHILVIKGYRKVRNSEYFEAYDPNSWHAAYPDKTPKGRNRHFVAGELSEAIIKWWPYMIIIPPQGALYGTYRSTRPWLKPVDPATIPQMGGM